MPKVYAIDGVTPVVDPTAFVHPQATLIGDVTVGPNCYVAPGASLRGDMGRIVMGRASNFQDNCVAHTFAGEELIIGDYVNIGHGAVLHDCVVGDGSVIGNHRRTCNQVAHQPPAQQKPEDIGQRIPADDERAEADQHRIDDGERKDEGHGASARLTGPLHR